MYSVSNLHAQGALSLQNSKARRKIQINEMRSASRYPPAELISHQPHCLRKNESRISRMKYGILIQDKKTKGQPNCQKKKKRKEKKR